MWSKAAQKQGDGTLISEQKPSLKITVEPQYFYSQLHLKKNNVSKSSWKSGILRRKVQIETVQTADQAMWDHFQAFEQRLAMG